MNYKKIIILTIILFSAICRAGFTDTIDLQTTHKTTYENKKVLHLPLINNVKKRNRYDKQINRYFENLLKDIKDIILLNESGYKILKRKLAEQEKIIQKKGKIKKDKMVRPLDIIIKGKYKFIHQPYKEKVGENRGDQFLTQRERFYFHFSVDIINAKTKRVITTLERSSYNENYLPALKQIAKDIEDYLKPTQIKTYYYPVDINFSPAMFLPLKNFNKISNAGAGLSSQINIQNYLFEKSVFGLNLDLYYISSDASRIDSYYLYTLNLFFGYRIIFNNNFFITPQIGCGYMIHHINNNLYFDPTFSAQLEMATIYKERYYLFLTPTYGYIKEKDQYGKFSTIKIGIKYFIN